MDKMTLTAEQWLEFIKHDENNNLPVWIHVISNSMYPFIRAHKDKVLLVPVKSDDIKAGDIVIFPINHIKGDYCLHRLYKVNGDMVQTMGDANRGSDEWFPKSSILGKVVLIQRGKITIDCESRKWVIIFRFWNIFWRIRPVMLFPFRVAGKCKRLLRRAMKK